MDRTSALDSAFLQVEDDRSALHIASVAIFAGPAPDQAEVLAAIAARLPHAPRLRQRLLRVPFGLGLPVWADDPAFDLHQHVRRLSLPAPGGEAELHEVVDQILSEHLDPDLPLWEDVVVEGLRDGAWALVTKVHHTMVDGIAGTDLLSTILAPGAPEPGDGESPWSPAALPGVTRLMATALRDQATLRLRELRRFPRAAAHTLANPREWAVAAAGTGRGLLGFARAAVPTSASSLVGPLGRDRCFRWTTVDLHDVLATHQVIGGTVNDLVLGVVAGAFRELLLIRGETPGPDAVRCLVPVSVRAADARGVFDNRVSALLASLPVEIEDPQERVVETAVRMRALKGTHEAQAGQWITALADATPPPALTAALHLAFRTPHRNLTTVVTNVPGPAGRLELAGRPMQVAYPYVPIADRLRIGVALTTYADRLLIGVTFDRESTPEIDAAAFVRALESGFSSLAKVAAATTTEKETAT